MPSDLLPGEDFLPGWQIAISLLYAPRVERESSGITSSVYKGTNFIVGVRLHPNLITVQGHTS